MRWRICAIASMRGRGHEQAHRQGRGMDLLRRVGDPRVVVPRARGPAVAPSLGDAEARAFKPDLGLVRYQKLWFWIVLTIFDGVLTIAFAAICIASPIAGVILFVPYLIVAILPDIIAYIAIHLRYDTTWYVLSSRAMRIRRGIWSIHETTITYENIQNVDVRQGPIERAFGISTLVVRTAGGGEVTDQGGAATAGAHVGLLQGIAEPKELRDQIMRKAAASRSAGLGDERADTALGRRTRGAVWSPTHIAVLREMRDIAVSLRG